MPHAKIRKSGEPRHDGDIIPLFFQVGYCGERPPAAMENVFTIVRDARDKAIARVKQAVSAKETLCGFQVDDAARAHIKEAGFADYFFHRTGHSIGADVHGTPGAQQAL